LIKDFNDGKNIDQSMLISARKEKEANENRAKQIADEFTQNEKDIMKLNEEFKTFKNELLLNIDDEINKYEKQLESQKDAYSKVAEHAQATIEKLIKDFNDGKNIDQSMLISARKEKEANENRAKQIAEEVENIKNGKGPYKKSYKDLLELKDQIQKLEIDKVDVKSDPAKPEPAKTEPTKTESAKSEPVKTEPVIPEPAKVEPVTPTEPAKPEPAKPEPAKPEPAKPEPAKPEPAKPEPAKPEPAKPEPAKPEPVNPVEPNQTTVTQKIDNLSIYTIEDKIKMSVNGDQKITATYDTSAKDNKAKTINRLFSNEDISKIFENADPNIVEVLKVEGKDKLKQYADALNGMIDAKEFKKILNITYDIKKLKSCSVSKEEKKALEKYAYNHRHIATIEASRTQKFKFLGWSIGDKIKGIRDKVASIGKIKMLNSGKKSTEPTVEQLNEQNKKMAEKSKKIDEFTTNFFKKDIGVENSDNHIENNATKNLDEQQSQIPQRTHDVKFSRSGEVDSKSR
ncbi:hypothetical protein IJ425_03320, partial [bacterium]|nr:hypothetical protein [bacterium]